MKKSIGDNEIPKGWGFERGLDLIRKSGFEGVELWLGDVPWFQMETSDSEVLALRRKVENAGLTVSNVSTGLHWKYPLSSPDAKTREYAIRIVERQIETAHLLGTDAILVVTGLVTESVPYQDVYHHSVEAMKQLAPQAAQAGVRIGCENCNAEQRIEILGPYITRIHVKDVMKKRGRCCDSVYTNIFLGDNNWALIRAALHKVGYDGWLVAEMERTYRFAPDQQFYDTSAALDRLISGRL